MTKQVKCISPHGGCHNGMYDDGRPVFAFPDGTIPVVPPEKLRLPPNPGGYITNARIPGYAAVGQVYDVADDFQADGFHFEDVAAPPPPPAPASAPPAEGQ
jgi:hypothetical protein